MSDDSEILFISDLHLDRNKPEVTRNFGDFLKTRAVHARVLYILGDLFEVWLGDDDDNPAFTTAMEQLRFVASRIPIYFMHGNRDFLVGESFSSSLGVQILTDPCVIDLGGQRIALMHGDLLCTDDIEYQKFRQMVRTTRWQQEFLSKSLKERQAIASGLRQKSAEAMEQKESDIMDVNSETVMKYFQDLEADAIIHGHTHRPAVHPMTKGLTRYVLGDWNPNPSFLSWKNNRFRLHDKRC